MSTNTFFLDFDSTYRNRSIDPNPGSFTIYLGVPTAYNALNAYSPYSNQVPSYPSRLIPATVLEPEAFISLSYGSPYYNYRGYLPFMFSTFLSTGGQNYQVLMLDQLPLNVYVLRSPQVLTALGLDFDDLLIEPLTISLETGQNFYNRQYLEDVLSGTFREIQEYVITNNITSPTYYGSGSIALVDTSNSSEGFVYPSYQIFTVLTNTIIPLSNINNFYRGKTMRMVTGDAAGEERKIILSGTLEPFRSPTAQTTLDGNINDTQTTIPVVSTIDPPPFDTTLPAYILVGTELMEYTGITAIQFTVAARVNGIAHIAGEPVVQVTLTSADVGVGVDQIPVKSAFGYLSPLPGQTFFILVGSGEDRELMQYTAIVGNTFTVIRSKSIQHAQDSIVTRYIQIEDGIVVDRPFEHEVKIGDEFVFDNNLGFYVRLREEFPNPLPDNPNQVPGTVNRFSQYPAYNNPVPPPITDPVVYTPILGRPYRIRNEIPFIQGLTDYVITSASSSITVTLPVPPAVTDPSKLIGQFVWVRVAYIATNNVRVPFSISSINPFVVELNDIRIIKNVDNTTPGQVTLTVDKPFSYDLSTYYNNDPNKNINLEWEILNYSNDALQFYNPPNSVITTSEMCCYEITLESLSVPNKILATGEGNLPAFYNYFYVELSNSSSTSGFQRNNIYSNNPNATRALFKVPIDNVNDPETASYVLLTPQMTQVVKFKMLDSFRLTIYLPNGDVFELTQSDTQSPDPPNPLLQISVLFSVRKL